MGRNYVDIKGQRFGMLTAIAPVPQGMRAGRAMEWECRCDCGGFHQTTYNALKHGTCTRCPECRKRGTIVTQEPTIFIRAYLIEAGLQGGICIAQNAKHQFLACTGWTNVRMRGSVWSYVPMRDLFDELVFYGHVKGRRPGETTQRWCMRNGISLCHCSYATGIADMVDLWACIKASGVLMRANHEQIALWDLNQARQIDRAGKFVLLAQQAQQRPKLKLPNGLPLAVFPEGLEDDIKRVAALPPAVYKPPAPPEMNRRPPIPKPPKPEADDCPPAF